jgi:fumarate hydratase subunit beta
MVGGKGGIDLACAEAMREVGCVYLSFLGGGSALHSAAIKAVRQVAWDDLVAHYRLVKLAVEGLGPLVVGIDARGNSSFERLGQEARDRMPKILAGLDAARAKAPR